MFNLVAYVDGGSLGNPGPAGIGVVIDGGENGTIKITKPIGHQDNNVAEYLALLEALQCAVDLGAKTLHVFSDSEVVVKQMTGEYTCRSTQLYSLNWICRKLARSLDFSISHVTRENILKPTAWLIRQHARRVDKNIKARAIVACDWSAALQGCFHSVSDANSSMISCNR